MTFQSSPMSSGRRPFFRQTAISDTSDFADGPSDAVLNTSVVPAVQAGFPRAHINGSRDDISHQSLPKSTAGQSKSLQKKSPLPKNRNESCSRSQEEPVSKTIQCFAKTLYCAQLAAYDKRLRKERDSEMIQYHQNASTEEKRYHKQEAKKPSRRRDIADGLPFSSGVLTDFEQEKVVSAKHQDFSDVLPKELDTSHQMSPACYCGGVQETGGCVQESRSSSVSVGEEGFQTWQSTKQASTSLAPDIQGARVPASGPNIPKIEVNDDSFEEEKCISDTGRQKGERFRQSKKSSGYGTGGSDDIPEGEFLSSVFYSSAETPTDKEVDQALGKDRQFFNSTSPNLEVNGACNLENLTEQPKAGNLGKGERQGECRDADLPPEAIIWELHPNIHVPTHEAIDAATWSQLAKYLKEMMKELPCTSGLKSLHALDIKMCEKPVFEWCESHMVGPLSSGSWANSQPTESSQPHPQSTEGGIGTEEHLQFSRESSEPLLYFSSHSVDSSIRDLGSQDGVDGKLDPPAYPSKGAEAHPTPQQLPDVGPTPRDSSHVPVTNGVTGPCHKRKSTGYGERDTRSSGVSRDLQPCPPIQQPWGCGSTGPSYMCRSLSLSQLESSIFCMARFPLNKRSPSNCNSLCLQGKRQVLCLMEGFQNDMIKDEEDMMRCLWHHSGQCREIQCIVPFCDVYRRSKLCKFEEQFAQMSGSSLKTKLHMELVETVRKHFREEKFLLLDPSSPISSRFWSTALITEGQYLGVFGDFNILQICVEFLNVRQPLKVVVKKAVCHPKSKNVLFKINAKSSPYILQNFWCSDLCKENRLLVCSAYDPEIKSLHAVMMNRGLSIDLCLTLLQQVVKAAIYLHSINIVYLNWKCSTVLWDGHTSGVNIKLGNFSRAVEVKQGSVVYCPGDIVDTFDPCFTAPEVFCGGPLSYNSDVWGIGCLLHEMVYRQPPYSKYCHKSPAQMRNMARNKQLEPHYPEGQLLRILCACWEPSASNRCTPENLLAEALTMPKMTDEGER